MLSSFFKLLKKHFFLLCFLFVDLFIPSNGYAIYSGVRDSISYDSRNNNCNTGAQVFDPFSNNKDIDWQLDNTNCIAYIASFGTLFALGDYATKVACVPTNHLGLLTKEPDELPFPPEPYPSPSWPFRLAGKITQCGKRSGEFSVLSASCAASGGTTGFDCGPTGSVAAEVDRSRCCWATTALAVTYGAAIGALRIIFAVSERSYSDVQICGNGWLNWENKNGVYTKTKNGKKAELQRKISSGDIAKEITIKEYREYLYGGFEYEDNGTDACGNPEGENWKETLGYEGGKQRYYMTGPGEAPSFACGRFLPKNQNDESANKAFDCCNKRSQNVVCIKSIDLENGRKPYSYIFCQSGSKCMLRDVSYIVYPSIKKRGYNCVKSYSLCPYNHLVGGGTEESKFDEKKSNIRVNHCQLMNHCSLIPNTARKKSRDSLGKSFLSSACYDLVGDSQNMYSFQSEVLQTNTRHFSAPIVQCVKETIENALFGIAGSSKCLKDEEFPDKNGKCPSDQYAYKKGQKLDGLSFFNKIQEYFRSIVKYVLIVSVTFYGVKTLLALGPITKKDLFLYITKICIVMYFVVGDAWQNYFLSGLIGSSNLISELTLHIDESADKSKLDGCQFPRFNYLDNNQNTKYAMPSYPAKAQYLRIWDTLDCKIAMALGFGPEVSVPNLVIMIFAGFLTGTTGIIFVLAVFFFAFFLISMTIRAMHIFLTSIIAIMILVYVSPIFILCSLFAKTRNLFDGWVKNVLGLALQPMILFAYLGIFVAIFNKTIIGDVTFTGDGYKSAKTMQCPESSSDNSVYCIFNMPNIKTFDGFEILGIGLPVLTSLNNAKISHLFKSALLMLIFSSFLDKISDFASKLVGGEKIANNPNWNIGTTEIASKAYGIAKGVQDRGKGLVRRAIKKGHSKATASRDSSQTKSIKSQESQKSQDNVTASSGNEKGNNNDNVVNSGIGAQSNVVFDDKTNKK
jgi:type IV secretory pathway VirB6-like protein